MERENLLVIVFLVILIFGLVYLSQNLNSFECFMENSFRTSSGISYGFEPQGSLYGEVRVFRFTVLSSNKRLEYFGMKVSKGEEVLFFENRTEPEGGSIVATINEADVKVERFFKEKCQPETRL